MARPEQNWITFEIDGKQVRAPEGAMLNPSDAPAIDRLVSGTE